MSKENRDPLHVFDPAIERLATERFLSGKQLFNYRTHRLKSFVRDDLQARAILIKAQAIAKEHGKTLALRYYEKRLLDGSFKKPDS
jgi:methionine salvage enolase-phosphatase E1